MELKEFLQLLYTFCSDGKNHSDFMIELFTKLTNEQENDFFDKKSDYLNRIFKGDRNIKKTSVTYMLSHLDKESFDNYLYELVSNDSLTELSYKFEDYIGNSTMETVTTKITNLLISILENIVNISKDKNQPIKTYNSDIYEEIDTLIRNINKLTDEDMDDIQKYQAFRVDSKIEPSNAALKHEIKSNVVDYYSYIEKLFAEEENSTLFFNFSNLVKDKFEKFNDDNMSQQMLFDNMCDWLKEKTRSNSQTACRIMISFFVQNCEVFHEITQ